MSQRLQRKRRVCVECEQSEGAAHHDPELPRDPRQVKGARRGKAPRRARSLGPHRGAAARDQIAVGKNTTHVRVPDGDRAVRVPGNVVL